MRPRSSTITRSTRSSIDGLCVTSTSVLPLTASFSCCSSSRSAVGSIALVGSSKSRIGGSPMSARAIPTAWRCPPDRPSPPSPSLQLVARRGAARRIRARRPSSAARQYLRIARPVGAERDVLAQRAAHQPHVLQHRADVAAQVGRVDLAHVAAADQQRARIGRVQAQQHLHQRRLARADAADDRHALAGFDAQRAPCPGSASSGRGS